MDTPREQRERAAREREERESEREQREREREQRERERRKIEREQQREGEQSRDGRTAERMGPSKISEWGSSCSSFWGGCVGGRFGARTGWSKVRFVPKGRFLSRLFSDGLLRTEIYSNFIRVLLPSPCPLLLNLNSPEAAEEPRKVGGRVWWKELFCLTARHKSFRIGNLVKLKET